MNTILLTGRDAPEVALPWPDLVALDSALEGNVMTPGDTGWDDAIRLWNGLVTKQPRCVVRVAGASDAAAAVEFAPGTTRCSWASRAVATTSPAPPSPTAAS